MRDPGTSTRNPKGCRPSLASWLLFLGPVAAMLLLLSHAGSRWFDRRGERPDGAAILPGLTVEATPPARGGPSARSHLVVTSIRSGSPATPHGITVGDTVEAIDRTRIFSLDQARHRLQKDGARTVVLQVVHHGERRNVRLLRAIPGREGERHEPQAARRRG